MWRGRCRGVGVGEGKEAARREGDFVRSDLEGTKEERSTVKPSACELEVLAGCASLRFFVEDVVKVSCHCSSQGFLGKAG